LELECLVSDKVSWSDTPTFHNTLVVGSSPTSSTTQLPATGEFKDDDPGWARFRGRENFWCQAGVIDGQDSIDLFVTAITSFDTATS